MSVLKNVLVVLRGSLAAQVISFATLPLLARLYTPEVFGRYQIFLSVLSFLLLSANLRYELSILNAETDEVALSLARLCFGINVLVAGVTLLVCVGFAFFAPAFVMRLGPGLWLLPAAVLAGGAFQTVTYLLVRLLALPEMSASKAVQALGYGATALTLGLCKVTNLGLLIADVAARVVALVFVIERMARKNEQYKLWKPRRHSSGFLLRKFRNYPLLALPGSLLNNLGGTLTPLLLFGVFGAATSGQYALVERCFAMPVAVIAQAVAQAYMASFSSALRSSPVESRALFRKVLTALFKVGALPTIILMFFGRDLFELVFGRTWSMAGDIAQVLAPMLFAVFLVSPVDMSLQILNRQALNFLWHLSRLMLVVGMWVVVSVYELDAMTTIQIYAAVSIIAYLALLFMIHRSLSQGLPLRSAAQ